MRKPSPRFPVGVDLVGPWRSILEVLEKKMEPRERMAFARAIEAAEQQAILLNQRLDELQNAAAETYNVNNGVAVGISRLTPRPVGPAGIPGINFDASASDHVHEGVHSINGQKGDVTLTVSGSVAYPLQILGPYVSVAKGTTWEALSVPVPATGNEDTNTFLGFTWSADNSAVNAEYRLWNKSASTVILSGSRAAPFSSTVETNTGFPTTMPAAGELVELQVRFSAAGSGGGIQLDGAGLWVAREAP